MFFPVLRYDEPVFRPPSEGPNLIIQATLGCSFNHCTFCSMYKTKTYRARPLAEVFADIDAAARVWPDARRVFLADGDALVLPTEDLIDILDHLARTFPGLERVSAYATPINLNHKPAEELRELRARRLKLVYLGIESGAPAILNRIRKGASPDTIVAALERARDADIKVSATVILGLGGQELWAEHIDGTVALINRAAPRFLSTLQLRLEESAVPEFIERFERDGPPFRWQDDDGILREQARLLAGLDPSRPVIFRSNHASNCLPLAGTLPRDRDRLLRTVALAQQDAGIIRPEVFRGL